MTCTYARQSFSDRRSQSVDISMTIEVRKGLGRQVGSEVFQSVSVPHVDQL